MDSTVVAFIGVGSAILIACITGFWAFLKALGSKFDELSRQIDANVSVINNAITELRVSQASVTARQDSLESFVRNLPQLLAQLLTASNMNPHHNTQP